MQKHELEELKVSIYRRLRQAVEEGNKEKALSLIDEIVRNKPRLMGIYLDWVDLLLTYINDKLGEDAVHEAMLSYNQRVGSHVLESVFRTGSPDEMLRKRCYVWNSLRGIDIEEIKEDGEKYTLTFKCDSGGSIRMKEHFGKTSKAYPWSWGIKGLSYYCTHCAMFDIGTIERFGYLAWANEPQPEGRCVQYVYKDPKDLPEKFYSRVGKKKPVKLIRVKDQG